MTTIRKTHSAQRTAQVALEAIKAQRTVNEIANVFSVHPNLVGQWKKQALAQLPQLFSDGRAHQQAAEEALQAQLYQQIGQLKVELDWLKKKVGRLAFDPTRPRATSGGVECAPPVPIAGVGPCFLLLSGHTGKRGELALAPSVR